MFNTDKKINIPKEFTLFGHKYDVVIKKDLFETEGCYGDADEDLKQIRLQDVGEVVKKIEDGDHIIESKVTITENCVIETFFHEVTHIILDAMGETQLSENEKFDFKDNVKFFLSIITKVTICHHLLCVSRFPCLFQNQQFPNSSTTNALTSTSVLSSSEFCTFLVTTRVAAWSNASIFES